MKDVNIILGRFQPFTLGHLSMAEAGAKKNRLPSVVLLVRSKKAADARHPFSDTLIEDELKTVAENYPGLIAGVHTVGSADIQFIAETCAKYGYMPHLWITGDDHSKAYSNMLTGTKKGTDKTYKEYYKDEYKLPDGFLDFSLLTLPRTNVGEDNKDPWAISSISGTRVRQAVKDGDRKAYDKMMPEGTDSIFDRFRKELDLIKEGMTSLTDFIREQMDAVTGCARPDM